MVVGIKTNYTLPWLFGQMGKNDISATNEGIVNQWIIIFPVDYQLGFPMNYHPQ